MIRWNGKFHYTSSSLFSFLFSFFFFFFFFFLLIITWSGLLTEIRLSICVPENLMHLILKERFWFVHIPFRRIVKFQIFPQFPADHIFYPVASSLLLLLRWCDSFAYNVIYRFVFVSKLFTLAILWRIIDFRFPYYIVLFLQERYSFSKGFPFLAMSKSPDVRFRQFIDWNIHTDVFSYHFSFLIFVVLFVLLFSVLLLTAVISPSVLFLL